MNDDKANNGVISLLWLAPWDSVETIESPLQRELWVETRKQAAGTSFSVTGLWSLAETHPVAVSKLRESAFQLAFAIIPAAWDEKLSSIFWAYVGGWISCKSALSLRVFAENDDRSYQPLIKSNFTPVKSAKDTVTKLERFVWEATQSVPGAGTVHVAAVGDRVAARASLELGTRCEWHPHEVSQCATLAAACPCDARLGGIGTIVETKRHGKYLDSLRKIETLVKEIIGQIQSLTDRRTRLAKGKTLAIIDQQLTTLLDPKNLSHGYSAQVIGVVAISGNGDIEARHDSLASAAIGFKQVFQNGPKFRSKGSRALSDELKERIGRLWECAQTVPGLLEKQAMDHWDRLEDRWNGSMQSGQPASVSGHLVGLCNSLEDWYQQRPHHNPW